MKKAVSLLLVFSIMLSLILSGCTDKRESLNISEIDEDLVASSPQKELNFPLDVGELSDTLSNNSTVGFKAFANQGTVYLKPQNVSSANIVINGTRFKLDKNSIQTGKNYRWDISKFTNNRNNSLQVNNIEPFGATIQIKIPYPSIIENSSSLEGLSEKKLDYIDTLINSQVEEGFPGGQLVIVKNGVMVKNKAYGYLNAYNQDGTKKDDAVKTNTDTLYDIASNTKMYATNFALQKLASEDKISTTDKINKYIPEFKDRDTDKIKGKNDLTLQNVLEHQAGFKPSFEYHKETYDKYDGAIPGQNILFSQEKDKTLEMICKTPLEYIPSSKTQYSDIDYMILGFVIEKVTQMNLDEYVETNIYKPLGLDRLAYNPLDKGFTENDCAATELKGNTRDGSITFQNIRTQTLQGQVHDEKAFYAMDGISGHAGLFASANQLSKLLQVVINEGGYDNTKLFDLNTLNEFIKPKTTNPTYGLGWRRQADSGYSYYFSNSADSSTVGHTGWTGTLTCIDPDENMAIVF